MNEYVSGREMLALWAKKKKALGSVVKGSTSINLREIGENKIIREGRKRSKCSFNRYLLSSYTV